MWFFYYIRYNNVSKVVLNNLIKYNNVKFIGISF